MNFKDSKILITGGGSGIGRAIALGTAKSGAEVLVVGRREDKLKEVSELNPNIQYFLCDVTSKSDVEKLYQHLEEEFPINGIIHNAGIAFLDSEMEGDQFENKTLKQVNLNLLAPIFVTNSLLPLLKKSSQQEKFIVMNTSITGIVPGSILSVYSATKAGLHSYSETLRFNLSEDGIKVFEILPPMVDTDMTKDLDGKKISPEKVAESLLKGMRKGKEQIYPGDSFILSVVNKISSNKAQSFLRG